MAASTPRLRYQVAASLDGFVAGPQGEHDWIPHDPDIDFGALFSQFDTLLMGRGTYAPMAAGDTGGGKPFGMTTYVASTTLQPADHPHVTVVGQDLTGLVTSLKAKPGKDIWLFGGGVLFRSLAALKLVDTVEIAVCPVLLGEGRALVAPPALTVPLRFTGHRLYPSSGIALLEYAVQKDG